MLQVTSHRLLKEYQSNNFSKNVLFVTSVRKVPKACIKYEKEKKSVACCLVLAAKGRKGRAACRGARWRGRLGRESQRRRAMGLGAARAARREARGRVGVRRESQLNESTTKKNTNEDVVPLKTKT